MDHDASSTYRSMRSSLYPFIRNQEVEEQTDNRQTNLQQSPRKVRINLLQRYHDSSYFIKEKKPTHIQKYAHILRRITRTFVQQQYEVPNTREQKLTFNPQSIQLFIWNILVVLSIVYHFFQIPICLFYTERAFHSQFRGGFGISCNVISLIVLLINMIYIIPNTQYFHKGFLVTKHEKIIRRYFGWRLIIDAIAYLSLFVFVVSNTYSLIYFKIVFYLMAYRLIKVDDLILRKIQLLRIRFAVYKLVRIIILMLFLVLWLGAIFFAIDYHYYLQGSNATYSGTQLWLTASTATNSIDIIQNFDNWMIWLDYSLYWSLQTVSMVGFGDLTPKNPVQVTFTSIVITLVVVSFAFFITGVWQIIAQARQHKEYHNKQWKVYKEYQKQNMRPLDRSKQASQKGKKYRELKNKVGSYLFEMWNHEKAFSEIKIVEVLQKSLTTEMKDEVFINYRRHLFQRIDLFQQLAQTETKYYKYIFRQLIFKITENKYAKNQLILQAGQLNLKLIYLVNGKLSIQYPNSNYTRTSHHSFDDLKDDTNSYIDKNSNFGVKQFFTQQTMPYSVRSDSFCKTSELSMDDLIKSIKQVDQFYVKYCELRDQVKLYNIDSLTGEQCIECGSNQHDIAQCEECDISMSYKRHWMRISTMKQQKPLNNEKNAKVQMRRKNIKSQKVFNLPSRRRQVILDQMKSYNFYYPFHNLSLT